MLTALGTVNRFQCIAASNREQISKQWEFAPRLLARLVNEQKWRKDFQSMIYTHVCRPNTCPYRVGSRLSFDFLTIVSASKRCSVGLIERSLIRSLGQEPREGRPKMSASEACGSLG